MDAPKGLFAIAAVLVLAGSVTSSAAARPRAITGELSAPNHTVIALAANGPASSVWVKGRRFRLRPPATVVTLHLRGADGKYAGPVVVARRKAGRRAITGVKAGTRLGAIKVRSARGFARVERRLPNRVVDLTRWGRARKGVPIGAGNFGQVRSKRPFGGVPDDLDRDGIPSPLDIDDDGDLLLDDVDRATARARAAQAQQFFVLSYLWLGGNPPGALEGKPLVNANAPGLSAEQVEAGLPSRGVLQIGLGGFNYLSAELDCGGRVWCSTGGTGERLDFQFDPDSDPFPECCDSDGDGLGSLDSNLGLELRHGATADQIRAGDVLILRVKCAGPCGPAGQESIELVGSLASIFATVPAVASYTDRLDEDGQGTEHPVAYPVTPGTVFPVADGPDIDSHVEVKLAFWRPQRRATPAEEARGAGRFMDMGRLEHFAQVLGGAPSSFCPSSSYAEDDSNLAPGSHGPIAVLADSAPDEPANSNSTFSYTLNLNECFGSHGETFDQGDAKTIAFDAYLPPSSQADYNTASFWVFKHE